jgi:ATP-dependent Clp protease protease subunit
MGANKMDELQLQFDLELLESREIYLMGEINAPRANKIGQAIVWLNAKNCCQPITLYINSTGGSVTAGFDICDIIRHSKAPVIGVVFRQANSMASVVLQACKTRKAMAHSILLLHNMKLTMEGEIHEIEEKAKKAVADARSDQQEIYHYLAEKTKISLDESFQHKKP